VCSAKALPFQKVQKKFKFSKKREEGETPRLPGRGGERRRRGEKEERRREEREITRSGLAAQESSSLGRLPAKALLVRRGRERRRRRERCGEKRTPCANLSALATQSWEAKDPLKNAAQDFVKEELAPRERGQHCARASG